MIASTSPTPPSNSSTVTCADITDDRPITQPTDRSMPPEMMTNVWPSPRSTTGTMVSRMLWELRRDRKLMTPSEVTLTLTVKNRISPMRKTHAQTRLTGQYQPLAASILEVGVVTASAAAVATRVIPPSMTGGARRRPLSGSLVDQDGYW